MQMSTTNKEVMWQSVTEIRNWTFTYINSMKQILLYIHIVHFPAIILSKYDIHTFIVDITAEQLEFFIKYRAASKVIAVYYYQFSAC